MENLVISQEPEAHNAAEAGPSEHEVSVSTGLGLLDVEVTELNTTLM